MSLWINDKTGETKHDNPGPGWSRVCNIGPKILPFLKPGEVKPDTDYLFWHGNKAMRVNARWIDGDEVRIKAQPGELFPDGKEFYTCLASDLTPCE